MHTQITPQSNNLAHTWPATDIRNMYIQNNTKDNGGSVPYKNITRNTLKACSQSSRNEMNRTEAK